MNNAHSTYHQWLLALIALVCCSVLRAQDVVKDNDEFRLSPDSVLLQRDTTIITLGKYAVLEADTAVVDSAALLRLSERIILDVRKTTSPDFKPDPIRALWLSLIFPGAGQIYNRKYWKLPIVYGGFLGCAYALTWNNQMLRDYSQAYLDIMDSDPNTKSYEKMLPIGYDISGREEQFKEIFKNKKNYFRKYRDMSIFAFFAVYAIAAIDAYVDAELSSFDISEDLTLRVTPAVISTRSSAPSHQQMSVQPEQGLGVALHLSF